MVMMNSRSNKKIILIIFMFLFSLVTLTSCDNSNHASKEPEAQQQVHKVFLNINNYQDYINMSYTFSINGPEYGNYGFSITYSVSIQSLNSKYEFQNVDIVFNHNSATKFKLSSSGNSTYTLTDYKTVNSGTNKVSIKEINGTVIWYN